MKNFSWATKPAIKFIVCPTHLRYFMETQWSGQWSTKCEMFADSISQTNLTFNGFAVVKLIKLAKMAPINGVADLTYSVPITWWLRQLANMYHSKVFYVRRVRIVLYLIFIILIDFGCSVTISRNLPRKENHIMLLNWNGQPNGILASAFKLKKNDAVYWKKCINCHTNAFRRSMQNQAV